MKRKDTPTLRVIYGNPYEEVRWICHGVKVNHHGTPIEKVDEICAALPKDSILIPIPGHQGTPSHAAGLAEDVVRRSTHFHKTVLSLPDLLTAEPRESLCEAKHNGKDIKDIAVAYACREGDMKELKDFISMGYAPVLLDNVIDTGTTLRAAQEAVGLPCLAASIGNTGASGLLPTMYYEIIRLSDQDPDTECFEAADRLADRGHFRKALKYLSEWDYGGENIDTARVYKTFRCSILDPMSPSDTILHEDRNEDHPVTLCESHSMLYNAYYTVGRVPADLVAELFAQ